MANLTQSRPAMADLGGKHFHDHRLVHDAPVSIRNNEQRASTDDAATQSTKHTGARGGSSAANEETANEDDEEDSSAGQDEDEEDPEVLAPSRGFGKGKGLGKRPVIRVEPAGGDESQDEDEIASRETGYKTSKHPVNQLLLGNKKRTYSNLSNNSVLFGDIDADQPSFPRRKMARTLSNIGNKPLLTYKEDANKNLTGFENAIESDDEDYSGVNLISDDESDLEQIEKEEESFIIEEERHNKPATARIQEHNDARRLSLGSHASDDMFDLTAPLDNGFLSGMSMHDIGFGQFFEPDPLPSSPDPSIKRKYSDSSTKRVRFDDEVQVSDDSSSSSSELDSSLFPDLFLEQDKLPPSLYQLLEVDRSEDEGDMRSPLSDASFWDFGHDEPGSFKSNAEDDLDDESSDPGSSGYETDMGDTTDDDSDLESDAPPQTPMKQSVLRRPSSAPGSRASTPKPFQRTSRPTASGRPIIPPTRGIFIHEDASKAIAVTNRTTKTLTFYRPRVPTMNTWIPIGTTSSTSSTANNSPRAGLQQQFNASDSEVSNEVFNNPFTTDIMLTGIFGAAPMNDFSMFGGESVGPPEAFYPFVAIGENGIMEDDDDDYDDDDYEDDLNITDFMDFGSDADATDLEGEGEGEGEDETDVPATPATSMAALNGSTPAQPTPGMDSPSNRRRNASDAMLEHFDRGVVTAFRNNQTRYRDIACLPSDPTIRASVSRPVRSGRSAETLMTPLRKRSMNKKAFKSAFRPSSPVNNASSPLAGVTKAAGRLQSSVMNGRRGPRMGTFT